MLRSTMDTCKSPHLCKDFVRAIHGLVKRVEAMSISTPRDSEGLCEMPGTCGPLVWAMFHGTAEAMRDEVCAHCGEAAVKFLEGLHDVVNRHLGKPLQRPESLKFLEAAVRGVPEAAHAQNLREVEHMLSLQIPRSLPQDHEIGAPICQGPGGALRLGRTFEGTSTAVDIPLRCAGSARPVGTWHTHPGGSPEPSSRDDAEARRLDLRVYCVTQPETGQTVCRRL